MRAAKSVLLASTILSAVSAYNLNAAAAPLPGEVLAQAAPAGQEKEKPKAAPAHPAPPAPPKPAPAPPRPAPPHP
ncbi:MAG: hypothetical protein WBG15_08090, partial [Xanthobacteraceae bacterium]